MKNCYIITPNAGSDLWIHGDSNSDPVFLATRGYTSYYEYINVSLGGNSTPNASAGRTLSTFTGDNSQYKIMFSPSPQQESDFPIFSYNSIYRRLIINLGINDAGQPDYDGYNTKALFKSSYTSIINKFVDLGWPLGKMIIINIGIDLNSDSDKLNRITLFNQAIDEVCASFSIIKVDWHAEQNGWVDKVDRLSDGLHYDSIGHQRLADLIISKITS